MSPAESSIAPDNAALKEKAAAAKDAVVDLAGETKRYAVHRAHDAKETASGWVDSAKSRLGDANDTLVDYVQHNPFKAVAIAVGIGFVAGLLLKRRRSPLCHPVARALRSFSSLLKRDIAMVAQTDEPSAGTADEIHADIGEFARDPRGHRANRGGLRRLVASLTRLADLQCRIWITEAKLAAVRIMAYIALFAAAALIALLGIIFLLIGLFHILTDVIGLAPVWSFLIFGAFLIIVAAILLGIAKSALGKQAGAPKKTDGGK